jgi:hypothetical protein
VKSQTTEFGKFGKLPKKNGTQISFRLVMFLNNKGNPMAGITHTLTLIQAFG